MRTLIRRPQAPGGRQSGVAAIELVLIIPLLLLMYSALVDVTGYVTANRRTNIAATTIADLVTQEGPDITAAKLDEYLALSSRIGNAGEIRVQVANFRRTATATSQIWNRNLAGAAACPITAPANINALAQNGDVIIVAACASYTPFMFTLIGQSILGNTALALEEQAVLRPRETPQLNCPDC